MRWKGSMGEKRDIFNTFNNKDNFFKLLKNKLDTLIVFSTSFLYLLYLYLCRILDVFKRVISFAESNLLFKSYNEILLYIITFLSLNFPLCVF